MTETPATTPVAAPAATPLTALERSPNRLTTVAAWVGIVAGVVFVVAVIFGTGFMLGAHSGHRGPGPAPMVMHRGGPPPMMFPAPPRGQFEYPGQGPGTQSPTPAPARP
ncbi:hypothetical protein [Mycolicibacterium sp. F2034L]|uniref:hypothetical protein n=1 Tax=Mycolicibacterium sp. F2034L TaxID=2926422 RepID=UPI001FF137A4|nr:hypothetical protein [Mycolicibacterium sp. F2034L]MCK0176369.1 hypothetical protein [Mycolicibacterium sp. F2034L]